MTIKAPAVNCMHMTEGLAAALAWCTGIVVVSMAAAAVLFRRRTA